MAALHGCTARCAYAYHIEITQEDLLDRLERWVEIEAGGEHVEKAGWCGGTHGLLLGV